LNNERTLRKNRLLYICYGALALLGLSITIPATSLKFIPRTFNLDYLRRGIFLATGSFTFLAAIVVGRLLSERISVHLQPEARQICTYPQIEPTDLVFRIFTRGGRAGQEGDDSYVKKS